MIKEYKTFGDLHNPDYEDTERIYKALENILSAYRNSIPKQKVKNKIEEAKDNKKVGNTAYEYTEEDVWDIVKDELEKLLEGE